jgi:hypothetical protein
MKRKKKAAKRSMMPWLIGGCGLFAALGCCMTGVAGGGIWFFFLRSDDPDLIYVHDGVAGFVSVRVADAAKHEIVKEFGALMKPAEKAEFDKKLAEAESKLGLNFGDVERVTFIMRSLDMAKKPEFVFVVRTTKAMDQKKLIDLAVKEGKMKSKEVQFDGKTLYLLEPEGPGDKVVLHFPSDKIVLATETEAVMKDTLKKANKTAKNAAIARGLDMVSSKKHTLVMAFELKKDVMKKLPEEQMKQAPNLRDMNGVIIAVNMAKEISIDAVLTFPDRDLAAKGKSNVDELVAVGKQGIKAIQKKAPPPSVQKFMDSISVEQRGPEVVVKAKVEVDPKDIRALKDFNPMMGGGPVGIGPIGADENIAIGDIMALDAACKQYKQLNNQQWPNSLNDLARKDKKGFVFIQPGQLRDPRGQLYQYNRAGPRNNGQCPDIWTVLNGKTIGNWPGGNP